MPSTSQITTTKGIVASAPEPGEAIAVTKIPTVTSVFSAGKMPLRSYLKCVSHSPQLVRALVPRKPH